MTSGDRISKNKKCNKGKRTIISFETKLGKDKKMKIGGECDKKRASVPKGEKSRYCFKHGCQSCYFGNLKTTTTSFGTECCEECKPKLESRKTRTSSKQQQNKDLRKSDVLNKFQSITEQLITNINNVFPNF